jgi:hypothetical protein
MMITVSLTIGYDVPGVSPRNRTFGGVADTGITTSRRASLAGGLSIST